MNRRKPTAGKNRSAPAHPLGKKTITERETALRIDEQAALTREEAADLRQEAASLREEATDLREEVATLREKALRAQEDALTAKIALSALDEAQLREANERLVVATLRAQTMTEAAEHATSRMSYQAEHDFLTGLPNRALLADRLAQAIGLALRHGKRVALMYLDLDHFKHINDSLGHEIGDQLLQSAAHRLQACVRQSDTISRQGGDEFVVLLAEVEAEEDAALTAEKLIRSMAEPHLIAGHRLHVTLSIGISLYPDDGNDVEALVRNADTAMYHAKNSGRNNYQRFTPAMNSRAIERKSVEAALRHGLDNGQFVLHFQPKVNLRSGAITGAEALLRLQVDGRHLLAPDQFVGIAEDSGLIVPIGKWALAEACRQMAAWLQAGLVIDQIAVNVSSVEFRAKDFLSDVRHILQDSGLAPQRLELELTESSLMQDTEMTATILHALKELGVQIAIDDFGTGYSSLGYLLRFPIDTLKIDQSFVRDIEDNGENAGETIVSAVIAMGSSLKQQVVAEGVETPHQLAFLQAHHCIEGQGFYFSKAVSADAFASLLTAQAH